MSYSVAIRTLGTAGDAFRRELESLHNQTVVADRILVYIAKGYERPNFQVGREEYIWVKKGMVAQRALEYREVDSDYILLLDDDVELAPDSVERMLNIAKEKDVDCVGADTFQNHKMSLKSKFFAALSNWVLPHYHHNFAFQIHSHGSFSYVSKPNKNFYLSQSCAGPASLWKKSSLLKLHLEDELWLDNLGFSFGDDVVEFYKLYRNRFRLGILFDSGVKNLDAKTSSGLYHKVEKKFYIRSKATFIIWWRLCYDLSVLNSVTKIKAALTFSLKSIWLLGINCAAGLLKLNPRIPLNYLEGLLDGWKFVHSKEYKSIPSYIIDKAK